jgi:hypothetical protein
MQSTTRQASEAAAHARGAGRAAEALPSHGCAAERSTATLEVLETKRTSARLESGLRVSGPMIIRRLRDS